MVGAILSITTLLLMGVTQTGEEIKIKAKKVAKFAPGKALKDAVG